jgi:hypothetical protein
LTSTFLTGQAVRRIDRAWGMAPAVTDINVWEIRLGSPG